MLIIQMEISTVLKQILFQFLSTDKQWLELSQWFKEKWNFPHCLGAMDGKHVVIQATFNRGSNYYNYKTNFSIVLFPVVDADYKFTFIHVGTQGVCLNIHHFWDGTLWRKTLERRMFWSENKITL